MQINLHGQSSTIKTSCRVGLGLPNDRLLPYGPKPAVLEPQLQPHVTGVLRCRRMGAGVSAAGNPLPAGLVYDNVPALGIVPGQPTSVFRVPQGDCSVVAGSPTSVLNAKAIERLCPDIVDK